MPIHLNNLQNAKSKLPSGIDNIVDEILHSTDEVHQFVRLIGAFEYFIKLTCAAMHGSVKDSHPGSWYGRILKKHFIEKSPSLGDWISSVEPLRKKQSGVHWLDDVVKEIWADRTAENEHKKVSPTWKMCRVVSASRTFLQETPKSKKYSIVNAFKIIVSLRNAFAHGAVTLRFAQRFGQPTADSLAEIATIVDLPSRWQFVVPLGIDQVDRNKAMVMSCDNYGLAYSQNEPKKFEVGERFLQWGTLYLAGKDSTSLESAISLEPLLRFERSHRDFQFFNRFDVDGAIAEYLSYKSGDFDWDTAFEDWSEEFGSREPDPEEDEEKAASDEPNDSKNEVVSPAEDKNFMQRLHDLLLDGTSEKTLRRCRERFREHLDDFATSEQNSILRALQEKNKTTENNLTHRVLGGVTRDFGLYELAIEELSKAAEVAPDDWFIKQSLGHSYLQLGTSKKAIGKDEHDDSSYDEGRALLQEALQPLRESISSDDTSPIRKRANVRSLSMLVDVYCRLGKFTEASETCKQGLLIEPENGRLLDQKSFLDGITTVQ